ncbi:MAG: helix-turn-helix domain-containing protein [Anaerolineae bacterium]|nr:helix-turn-helix domain-containing protein [Anaerolineae bacterium]
MRQAADLLGVHPATVRNWADEGRLASRRTVGKHRRFHRDDVLRFAGTHDDIQPVEVQVIIQNALGSARMNVEDGTLLQAAWYQAISEQGRQAMRQYGRLVLEAMRRYLSSGAPDAALGEAVTLGKDYARLLSISGLTLPQATRGFFYFSDFVVNSILTWSELAQPRNPAEWAHLLRQVNTFIHAMLLSIIEYYEAD